MLTWKPGVKVVREELDKYVSCTIDGEECIYVPGEITVPKEDCGPLAVFSTGEDAEDFLCTQGWLHSRAIIPCAYTESEERLLYYIDTKSSERVVHTELGTVLPKNTIFADRVMLLSE